MRNGRDILRQQPTRVRFTVTHPDHTQGSDPAVTRTGHARGSDPAVTRTDHTGGSDPAVTRTDHAQGSDPDVGRCAGDARARPRCSR